MQSATLNKPLSLGKIVTSTLFLSLILNITPACAEEPKAEAPKTEKSANATQQASSKPSRDYFEMMASRLELTDKQKAELKPLLQKLKTEREETLKKLDEKQHKELLTILNEDQSQKVGQFLKRSERMENVNRGPHGDRKGIAPQERKPQPRQPQPPVSLPTK